ncbi:tetratricopeptide repeat protein [Thermoflexus sp.]|uniref:tetratricopeptide repeat protein n=1 Tax=Thermoflexus sp. TaxID=1969742 RepID=UPI0025CC8B72|nr:tetratricopeptide repeat protein [Thermoflexus sp.]
MRRGGWISGLIVLAVLLTLDPLGIPAVRWIREGDALWADGQGLSAQRAYQAALALRPMDPAVWHRVARAHAALGELEEAEAAWRRAMERGDPWTLRGLAAIATQRGEWEQARARWRDWALRSPSDREAFRRWAEAAMALGDEQDARRAWETGVSYHPDDLQIRFRLGLLRGAQDPEVARALLASLPSPWKEWSDLLPAPCAPHGLCGESASDQTLCRWGFALLGAWYWGEARLALARWVERHPEDPVAMAALGYALGRLGLDGTAWLRRASEGPAIPPEVHYFWGLYLLERGRYQEARGRFAAAYQLDPNPLYALERGRAAMLDGDLLTAERWLRQALEADRGNVEIWITLATLYLGHQVWIGKGIEAAQEILQRAPHRVEGYEWMGWAHYLRGEWAEAERLLRQALQMAPDRPSIRYRLGMVLAAKGQREEARRLLEQTILLDPRGGFGRQALRMLTRLQGR